MNLLLLQDAVGPRFFDYDLNSPDLLGGWLVCFFTLAVFSFLYRDNPFYKFSEHVFVGVGTAWFTMEYYDKGIKKPLIEHIEKAREKSVELTEAVASGTASAEELEALNVMLGGVPVPPLVAIIARTAALVLGLFLLVRLFKRDSWMPRWPLAIMVGVYAALKMTGEVQSKLVLQVAETMKNPLAALEPADVSFRSVWHTVFGEIVFLIGVVCVLSYFLFTLQRNKALQGAARVGVITLMITFGSMFGFTVLGRIALLIERVADLDKYAEGGFALFGGFTALSPPFVAGALIIIGLLFLKNRAKPEATH